MQTGSGGAELAPLREAALQRWSVLASKPMGSHGGHASSRFTIEINMVHDLRHGLEWSIHADLPWKYVFTCFDMVLTGVFAT